MGTVSSVPTTSVSDDSASVHRVSSYNLPEIHCPTDEKPTTVPKRTATEDLEAIIGCPLKGTQLANIHPDLYPSIIRYFRPSMFYKNSQTFQRKGFPPFFKLLLG